MLRKIILAGIMTVAVIVIIVALNRMGRQGGNLPPLGQPIEITTDQQTDVGKQFELRIPNEQREIIVCIKGEKAVTIGDGPTEVTKPDVAITSDPTQTILITADRGTLSGPDREKPDEAYLRDNVVVKFVPVEGDPAVLTCRELRFFQRDQRVLIPDELQMVHPAFRIEGRNAEGSGTVGRLVLKENVRVTIIEGLGSLWDRMEGTTSSAAGDAAQPVPLVITCAGNLVFEDKTKQATFNDDVRAVQGDSSATADKMAVLFERKEKTKKSPADETADARSVVDKKTTSIRKVILQGTDVDRVQLTGPGRHAWGEELTIDTQAGLGRLAGRNARLVEERDGETMTLAGSEMQFGDAIVVPEGVVVPKPMQEPTGRILVLGAPARLSVLRKDADTPEVLNGNIILMHRAAGAVLVASPGEQVRVAREGLDLFGRSVTLFQKTPDRAESIAVLGPGKVVLARKPADASAPAPEPAVVTFSKEMTYQVDTARVIFDGNVSLVDGASKLDCQKLRATVISDKGKAPQITDMLAVGNVTAFDGTQKLVGQTLELKQDQARRMVLTGASADAPAEVLSGNSLLRCPSITYIETPGEKASQTRTRITGTGGGYLRVASDNSAASGTLTAKTTEVWFGDQLVFQDDGAPKEPRAEFSGKVRCLQGAMQVKSETMAVGFRRAASSSAAKGFSALQASSVQCDGDVQLAQMNPDVPEADRAQGFCDVLRWDTTANQVKLLARPDARGGRDVVRLLQGGNTFQAPVVTAVLTDTGFQRADSEGGGTLIACSRTNALKPDAEPRPITITWKGRGNLVAQPDPDPTRPPAYVASFQGETVSQSLNDRLNADTLEVTMRPVSKGEGAPDKKPSSSLDVQRIVAVGHAKADLYDASEENYRYARGSKLTWDRTEGRIVLQGPDALAWGPGGEWRGDEILITQRSDGSLFIHSAGTQMIYFADERQATVKEAPLDHDKWEPLD